MDYLDFIHPRFEMELSEQEEAYGFHAGEVETSWMRWMKAGCASLAAELKKLAESRSDRV
ncbi:MAG: hypothetical protein O3C20_20050 [Verrucomicrobia bacterium]|nr:hypothetical protein [Verrucomicrobiota bacterium]